MTAPNLQKKIEGEYMLSDKLRSNNNDVDDDRTQIALPFVHVHRVNIVRGSLVHILPQECNN